MCHNIAWEQHTNVQQSLFVGSTPRTITSSRSYASVPLRYYQLKVMNASVLNALFPCNDIRLLYEKGSRTFEWFFASSTYSYECKKTGTSRYIFFVVIKRHKENNSIKACHITNVIITYVCVLNYLNVFLYGTNFIIFLYHCYLL